MLPVWKRLISPLTLRLCFIQINGVNNKDSWNDNNKEVLISLLIDGSIIVCLQTQTVAKMQYFYTEQIIVSVKVLTFCGRTFRGDKEIHWNDHEAVGWSWLVHFERKWQLAYTSVLNCYVNWLCLVPLTSITFNSISSNEGSRVTQGRGLRLKRQGWIYCVIWMEEQVTENEDLQDKQER